MSGLVSKGLVEETIDRPKRYTPVDAKHALPRLARRIRDRFEKIAEESEQLAAKLERVSSIAKQTAQEEVRVIYGAQSANAHLLESIGSAQVEFWGMAGRRRPPHISDRFLAEALRLVASKGLKARLIIEVDRENLKRVKKMTGATEVAHYQPIPGYMYGVDDKMVAVSLVQEPITHPSQTAQLVSTYRPTVMIMRQFYDILWQESIPLALHEAALSGGGALGSGSLMTRSREQAYVRAEALAKSAKKSIRIYAPHRFEPIRLLNGLGDTLLNAHSRGVKNRMIVALSEENLEAVKKLARFMELRHTNNTLGFSIDIVDDINAEISYVHQDIKELKSHLDYSIHVTSREGIRHISNLFEAVWQESVPVEQVMQEYERHRTESQNPAS
jgi:sugar-specific transcriptional regulator TrmB